MNETYRSPLESRYASREMRTIWSPQRKFSTWRRIWLALAEAQRELGLNITQQQIDELRAHLDDIDFAAAERYESKLRHDVMAHVHALGDVAPTARPIIHLGATSQDIVCNADLIQMRESLQLIASKLARIVDALGTFAIEYRDLPTLGFTHFQPAQPTTVGKRATLWAYDFVLALEDVEERLNRLRLRGFKGATGTQASFLALFVGDERKVDQLDALVMQKLGWNLPSPTGRGAGGEGVHDGQSSAGHSLTPTLSQRERELGGLYAVSGQTYPRLVDAQIINALAVAAAAVHKCATDIRLLANRKELEEPFEKDQIGSSAMAYKRNPMRCERACGIARFVMSLAQSPLQTAATQWLERTLDDSSNRRLVLAETFLALDGVLDVMHNVTSGLVVYEKTIRNNLMAELPFMATENILMASVATGGADRQEAHEVIRTHSHAAALRVKTEGGPNDLLERLRDEPMFRGLDWDSVLDPYAYVGRAPEQVDRFIEQVVEPIRARYANTFQEQPAELRV